MTVTDELLEELDCRHLREPKGAIPVFCSGIAALTAELRRLRAENADLAQSLAESRANDQAAMGWLTALRWASGDRGERMLPELVSHIEGLVRVVKDVRWRVADTTDQLQAYGYNGDRLYGLDEWSVPIRNLNIAIGMLEKATQ